MPIWMRWLRWSEVWPRLRIGVRRSMKRLLRVGMVGFDGVSLLLMLKVG